MDHVADSIDSALVDPWAIVDYEADMFFGLCSFLSRPQTDVPALPHHVNNAVVESALLHTRILVDILLSRGRETDDIRLCDLLPSFQSETIEALREAYGSRKAFGTPCWTLNKMLAHPTKLRRDRHDYTETLRLMHALLCAAWDDVGTERGRCLFLC